MKLQQLNLLAFGPFTDVKLEFEAGDPGLHIVFGPNEAGKSSALSAIRDLLYGIPTKSPHNHIHRYQDLKIGGKIVSGAGEALAFLRRKRNKNSLLTLDENELADDALRPFLGGIDDQTFDRVYGIDHDELRAGGDEMKKLKGLVGESLFAATMGGPGLARKLAELDKEAADLYASKKPSSKIRKQKKQTDELKKKRRASRLTATQWTTLQTELQNAVRERDKIVERTTTLKQKLSRLQRQNNGLSHIGRLQQANSEIEKLGEVVELPEGYNSQNAVQMKTQLEGVQAELEKLSAQVDPTTGLPSQIEKLSSCDELLACSDQIESLQDTLAVHLKAVKDQEKLRRDCEVARSTADELLRELGLRDQADDVEKFRPTPEERVEFQKLASEERTKREKPNEVAEQIASRKRQLEQWTTSLNSLAVPSELSDLRQTVKKIHGMGDLSGDQQRAADRLAQAERKADQCLAALGLWSGTLAESIQLAIPPRETIQRFDAEFNRIQSSHEVDQREAGRLRAELAEAEQSIAAVKNAGHVATESDLIAKRKSRDGQWQQLRSQDRIDDQQASEFESSIRETDDVADRLRREADRAAQLAQFHAQAQRIQQELETHAKRELKNEQAAQQLDAEWTQQWSPLAIRPLPPNEMLEWLSRLENLHRLVHVAEDRRSEFVQADRQLQNARSDLQDALAETSEKSQVNMTNWTWDRLQRHANCQLDSQQELSEKRSELERDINQVKSELCRLQDDAATSQSRLDDWLTKWQLATTKLGLEVSASAEQLIERMDNLQNFFKIEGDIEAKQKRIRDMQSDSDGFAKESHSLAARFLNTDQSDQGQPTEIAILLKTRLKETVSAVDKRERLEQELAAAQQELAEQRRRETELQQKLREHLSLARADNVAALSQIVSDSNALRRWSAQRQEADTSLHELCAGDSVPAFVADSTELDKDKLDVDISELAIELEGLEASREEAAGKIRECELRVEAMKGDTTAAELDEQLLGVIAGMHDDAYRYMKTRLASQMLRRCIDDYRADNEDSLFVRAGTLFSQMTCGEFSAIKSDYDDGDSPVIVGVRSNGSQSVGVEQMSDGTRDQLYLALRLAYVEKQLVKTEPMPFIVDDILVHYDDARSIAALKVLSELARQTQVIFFTHHRHLTDLALANLPADTCFIHQLDSRKRSTLASAQSSSRPR